MAGQSGCKHPMHERVIDNGLQQLTSFAQLTANPCNDCKTLYMVGQGSQYLWAALRQQSPEELTTRCC